MDFIFFLSNSYIFLHSSTSTPRVASVDFSKATLEFHCDRSIFPLQEVNQPISCGDAVLQCSTLATTVI